MKRVGTEKKITENGKNPVSNVQRTGRTRKFLARMRKAARKRARIASQGLRNFALDARSIPI